MALFYIKKHEQRKRDRVWEEINGGGKRGILVLLPVANCGN